MSEDIEPPNCKKCQSSVDHVVAKAMLQRGQHFQSPVLMKVLERGRFIEGLRNAKSKRAEEQKGV